MKYIYILFIIALSIFIYNHIQYSDIKNWGTTPVIHKQNSGGHYQTYPSVGLDGKLHGPSGKTWLEINYEYEVDGNVYLGVNYTPDYTKAKSTPFEKHDDFKTVYYNPKKTSLYVLIPEPYIGIKWLIIMGVFGIIIIGHIIKTVTE